MRLAACLDNNDVEEFLLGDQNEVSTGQSDVLRRNDGRTRSCNQTLQYIPREGTSTGSRTTFNDIRYGQQNPA